MAAQLGEAALIAGWYSQGQDAPGNNTTAARGGEEDAATTAARLFKDGEICHRLSRRLAYMMRHHQSKKRADRQRNHATGEHGGQWPQCYFGGWFDLRDLVCSTSHFRDLRAQSSGSDDDFLGNVRLTVQYSFSTRTPDHKRFELLQVGEKEYIRARYNHSFDIHDSTLPRLAGTGVDGDPLDKDHLGGVGGQYVPRLRDLCIANISRHVKSYEPEFGWISDPHLLNMLWNRLVKDRKMNNTVIKGFAVEITHTLDLGPVSSLVTQSTLHHIAKNCPEIRHLSLNSCVVTTEQVLSMISKRCKHLEHLDLSNCPQIKPEWLLPLAKLPALSMLDLTGCGEIRERGTLVPLHHAVKKNYDRRNGPLEVVFTETATEPVDFSGFNVDITDAHVAASAAANASLGRVILSDQSTELNLIVQFSAQS